MISLLPLSKSLIKVLIYFCICKYLCIFGHLIINIFLNYHLILATVILRICILPLVINARRIQMKTVNMVPQTSLLMHKIQDKNLPLEERMKTVDSVRVYLSLKMPF